MGIAPDEEGIAPEMDIRIRIRIRILLSIVPFLPLLLLLHLLPLLLDSPSWMAAPLPSTPAPA